MQYRTYHGNLLISFVCVWSVCVFVLYCEMLQFAIQKQTELNQTNRQSGSLFQFSAFSVIFMTTFCILLRHTHAHTVMHARA